MRKLPFGIVWFVVLYFAGCMVAGGIAGGIAGSEKHASVEAAQQAGAEAGAKAVTEYHVYIIAMAALLAAMGCIAGVLPGTRDRVVATS